jgi:hypothetical protein
MGSVGFELSDMIAFWKSPRIIKKSGKNDRLEKNRGGVTYYLFDQEIAHYDPDKKTIRLTDAGWRTHTTKDRLNKLLGRIGGITQKQHQWYYVHGRDWNHPIPWNGSMLLRV